MKSSAMKQHLGFNLQDLKEAQEIGAFRDSMGSSTDEHLLTNILQEAFNSLSI